MKKAISLVLALVMLALSLPASAAAGDAEKMQSALLSVKEKISVPEELSEFSGNVSERGGKTYYYFDWSTTDYEKSISASADSNGRITSYYDSTFNISDKRISGISKAELISYAEAFLEKTVPEAFISENDRLFYNEDGYYASGNLRYSLEFERRRYGVPVKNNYANLTLCISEDKIYVRNMNISFDYEAEFEEPVAELEDYAEKYTELFPAELVYRDEYNSLAKGNEPKNVPRLIYRIKDNKVGYMDIATGEELTESAADGLLMNAYKSESSAEDSGASGGSSLSAQEIAELENVEGLLSVAELEEKVKKLPYVDFTDELEMQSSRLYKDELGKYCYRINYKSTDEKNCIYFNMRANAETGELLSLSDYSDSYGGDVQLTESEIAAAKKKISEFLNAAASEKLAQTEEESAEDCNSEVISGFVRIVNGVKYVDNGISISFDAKNNLVTSYNLTFTDAEFTDPKNVIGSKAAYEKIIEYAPISPIYIRCGEKYKKAVSLEKRSVELDALSGKIKNESTASEYLYSDIAGHWAEEAATKLSEIQIGFAGGLLEPDKRMTQEEFLRLAASAIIGQYYGKNATEEFYEMLIRDKLVSEGEKAPDAEITREDAFVYVVRMAGYERVAKLTNIYKVSYADQSLLSEDRIGYAAILSGLSVICGDGGNLRPKDALTRAEAMVLVYKYLLSL